MQSAEPDNLVLASNADLPTSEVEEVSEQTFRSLPSQRGEGQPSARLREHLVTDTTTRSPIVNVKTMMVNLLLFCF